MSTFSSRLTAIALAVFTVVSSASCRKTDAAATVAQSMNPVVTTPVSVAAGAAVPPPAVAKPSRQNWVATFGELSKRYKNILILDNNHSDEKMRAFGAEKEVVDAIRAHSDLYIKEAGVDQNKGRDPAKIAVTGDGLEKTYVAIINALTELREIREPQGSVDKMAVRNAGNFILKLQTMQQWGWDGEKNGLYTYEFDAHIRSRLGNSAVSSGSILAFLNAMKYLKDTGEADQKRTNALIFDDMCTGRILPGSLVGTGRTSFQAEHPEARAQIELAEGQLYAEACRTGLKFYYPDHRHGLPATKNPEFLSYARLALGLSSGDDIYDAIRIDAELNADPSLKAGQKKMDAFLKEGLSASSNRIIVNNMKQAANSKPFTAWYGAAHMTGRNDFNEMLGAKDTVTIMIFHGPNDVYVPDDTDITDPPDYIYDIEKDIMLKTSENPEAFLSRLRPRFSKDEYDAAVAKLPERLKEHANPYSHYSGKPKPKQISFFIAPYPAETLAPAA